MEKMKKATNQDKFKALRLAEIKLTDQEDYKNCGLDVGVYYGDRKELGKTHTICTWQSLNVLDKKTKNHEADIITLKEFLDGVCGVIVDEVTNMFNGSKILDQNFAYMWENHTDFARNNENNCVNIVKIMPSTNIISLTIFSCISDD